MTVPQDTRQHAAAVVAQQEAAKKQAAKNHGESKEAPPTNFSMPPHYTFQKQLGSGSYGTVHAYTNSVLDKRCAVKRIKNVFDDFLITRRTLREIKLMRHFNNKNIIRMADTFIHMKPEEQDKKEPQVSGYTPPAADLYMVTDLMEHDLDLLIRNKKSIAPEYVCYFTFQILQGLKYLHSGHVVHRDLKPANIFVDRNGVVKLGDLGLARCVQLDSNYDPLFPENEQLTEYVVTRWYRSPEILILRGCYGPICDVWSVGCILFEMITSKVLLPGRNGFDQLYRIMCLTGVHPDLTWLDNTNHKLTPHMSTQAKNLMDKIYSHFIYPGTGADPEGRMQDPKDLYCSNQKCHGGNGCSHSFCGGHGPSEKFQTDCTKIECVRAQKHFRIRLKKSYEMPIDEYGPDMRNLLEKMLIFNPEKRITVDDALHHAWFMKQGSVTKHIRTMFGAGQYENLAPYTDRMILDAEKTKIIDMKYDLDYDNQGTDMKNMPAPLRMQVQKQLREEVKSAEADTAAMAAAINRRREEKKLRKMNMDSTQLNNKRGSIESVASTAVTEQLSQPSHSRRGSIESIVSSEDLESCSTTQEAYDASSSADHSGETPNQNISRTHLQQPTANQPRVASLKQKFELSHQQRPYSANNTTSYGKPSTTNVRPAWPGRTIYGTTAGAKPATTLQQPNTFSHQQMNTALNKNYYASRGATSSEALLNTSHHNVYKPGQNFPTLLQMSPELGTRSARGHHTTNMRQSSSYTSGEQTYASKMGKTRYV